ncbi:minor capsid protein [Campylobacter sp. faydin G-105]|uniref:phage head morphogenesis protein n=1 Tax=Campylobacter anatolicus TaxID=2829105 RepID=UPI001B934355|nr:phage minor head protein [Campylobacter anatolicus]MBR8461486.1 minor capsid protein [Campylobacter anatolicus]
MSSDDKNSPLKELFKLKRTNKFKPSIPSKRAEVKYRDSLLTLLKGLKKHLQEKIKDYINANAYATQAQIFNYITQTLEQARNVEILRHATLIATAMVGLVNRLNKKQLTLNLKNSSGVDVEALLNDKVVKNRLDEYIAKNVSLITSIKNDYLSDVEKQIRNAYLNGDRVERLTATINERYKVSKSRARLIARDQTNKLNAELSQERSISLGLKYYEWQTSKDERVRKAHANMDGKLCRYDDDSVYSDDNGKTWKKRTSDMPKAKPGIEIQCRCNAIAIIGLDDEI